MAEIDYYKSLEIERDADAGTIKKAYRKLALKYHPDRNRDNPEAEQRFKEISEAYEVLSDPEKRQRYDQFGYEGVQNQFGQDGFSWQDFHHFNDIEDLFGGIFDSFFGGGGRMRGGRRVQRGRDLRVRCTLTLEEAFDGKSVDLKVKRLESCETCGGNGCKPGTNPTPCNQCGGTGQVRVRQAFMTMATTCAACGGRGQRIQERCPDCGGQGRLERTANLTVDIPAGIDDGNQLRLTGEGEAGPDGGPRGDLYVLIQVEDHELFVRRDNDLYVEVPLNFSQAALGDTIEVPTIKGETSKLRIPEGTQTHQVFRVRDEGMPRATGADERGDLYVRVMLATPRKLNDEQRELFERLAEIDGEKLKKDDRSLFERIGDGLKEIKKDWLGS